ncbi:MAG: hypothetical protein QY304_01225 [Candidatus Paceibacterota bacterium]|nr:MAG: hypothetical protein QY304_01225 [Candidatus Paceibacterota bacterium]
MSGRTGVARAAVRTSREKGRKKPPGGGRPVRLDKEKAKEIARALRRDGAIDRTEEVKLRANLINGNQVPEEMMGQIEKHSSDFANKIRDLQNPEDGSATTVKIRAF